MSLVRHYKELKVYKLSFELAMRIYELSKNWPPEERHSLTAQIRRSSRSVCSNIAEAWGKRRFTKHFISKLSDADTEVSETQVWLDFAQNCGYMDISEHESMYKTYESVSGGLVKMMVSPEGWCGPAQLAGEGWLDYRAEGP